MATKLWAIGLVVLCTAFTSFAQIFYKYGANRLPEIITNVPLIAGLFLYGIGAVLLIVSFKGGDVSVLYPIIATSYIWVSLLSNYYFQEQLNMYKWIGIAWIIAGIIMISWSSKKDAVRYMEAV